MSAGGLLHQSLEETSHLDEASMRALNQLEGIQEESETADLLGEEAPRLDTSSTEESCNSA